MERSISGKERAQGREISGMVSHGIANFGIYSIPEQSPLLAATRYFYIYTVQVRLELRSSKPVLHISCCAAVCIM